MGVHLTGLHCKVLQVQPGCISPMPLLQKLTWNHASRLPATPLERVFSMDTSGLGQPAWALSCTAMAPNFLFQTTSSLRPVGPVLRCTKGLFSHQLHKRRIQSWEVSRQVERAVGLAGCEEEKGPIHHGTASWPCRPKQGQMGRAQRMEFWELGWCPQGSRTRSPWEERDPACTRAGCGAE